MFDREQARAEWTAIVAHDLRQPANSLQLETELLLRGALDERQRETIRRMRSSLAYLDRLIGDLTDAACIEAGRVALRIREIELGALVNDVAEHERWPRAHVQVSPSAATVRCDPDRARQILENLLSNAVKYGDPDATIDVLVDVREDFGCVTVANHGQGIPADEVPVVFERYGRTRDAAASSTRGSGLGMFIAKGLVEAQGGRIWVDSVPGETTSFHVALPLASAI